MYSFKKILPSLLLIGIYFVADEFFGARVGVICALILGIAEFLYTRIHDKIYDQMIVWMTLFFCLPGSIAFFPQFPFLLRLQPALTEGALAFLLGFLVYSRTGILAGLPAASRQQFHLAPGQQQEMKNLLKKLFFLVGGHFLFLTGTIVFHAETWTAFLSDLFPYLLAGFFGILIFRQLALRRKLKKEEWLPIVNEQGEVTGQASRRVCHSGTKLLHPVVHLHILNEKHQFLLQKRSLKKDLLPGMWDTAVGGHIGINEHLEEALKRETREELGMTDFQARFIGSYVWESPREKELVFSFFCTQVGPMHIDNDEVDEVKFWSPQEIQQGIQQNLLTPNFIHEYRTLLTKLFQN